MRWSLMELETIDWEKASEKRVFDECEGWLGWAWVGVGPGLPMQATAETAFLHGGGWMMTSFFHAPHNGLAWRLGRWPTYDIP